MWQNLEYKSKHECEGDCSTFDCSILAENYHGDGDRIVVIVVELLWPWYDGVIVTRIVVIVVELLWLGYDGVIVTTKRLLSRYTLIESLKRVQMGVTGALL